MKEFILICIAYLIGSIPTALIISKYFFKIDIREYGSGNMGATNTFRVLGPKFGTIVMVGDMLKGIFAVALYNFLPYYLTNELDRTNLMRISCCCRSYISYLGSIQGRKRCCHIIWNGAGYTACHCLELCSSFSRSIIPYTICIP